MRLIRLLPLVLMLFAVALPLSAQDDDAPPFALPDPDLELAQAVTSEAGDLTLSFPDDWDLLVDPGQMTFTTAGVDPNVDAGDVPDGEMLGLLFTPALFTFEGGFIVESIDDVMAQMSELLPSLSQEGVYTIGPATTFTYNDFAAAYRTGTLVIQGAKLNFGLMVMEVGPDAYTAALYFAQTASLDAYDSVILAVLASADYVG